MNVALIGYGYWGINLARNVVQNSKMTLKYIVDTNKSRIDLAQKTYSGVSVIAEFDVVLKDPNIDAIIIATNPASHYELAKKSLQNGKHTLVEKPMVTEMTQAEDLHEIAEKNKLTLMVDHTFMYNGVVRKMKQIIDSDDIGDVKYIDATRINLGVFQNDINVLWDLATHDLSIVYFLMGSLPNMVSAIGKCHIKPNIENIAYLILQYDNDVIVHIHSSWMSPVKIRKMLIGGDKKMIVYDDIEPTEKLKIYDSSIILNNENREQLLVDYRIGDVFVPKYNTQEPLALMIQDFEQSIITNRKPLSDLQSSINVIKILKAAQASILHKGREIQL